MHGGARPLRRPLPPAGTPIGAARCTDKLTDRQRDPKSVLKALAA